MAKELRKAIINRSKLRSKFWFLKIRNEESKRRFKLPKKFLC